MICVASFIVFSILGIFSIKYRRLAAESFKCFTRMAVLRPCDSSLSRRIRVKLSSKAGKIHPLLGKLVYKSLPALSFVFVVAFLVSMFLTIQAVMNLVIYGTCNPATGKCIITGSG